MKRIGILSSHNGTGFLAIQEACEKKILDAQVVAVVSNNSEANVLVKELVYKLEKKDFEIAKQYNTISDYEASIRSFDNFIFQYPGSTFREEALFYRLDSAYKLAINSVRSKKRERLEAAREYLVMFNKAYADSIYLDDLDKMSIVIEEELKEYTAQKS